METCFRWKNDQKENANKNNDIINLYPNKKTHFDYRSVVGKEGRGGILLPGQTDMQ